MLNGVKHLWLTGQRYSAGQVQPAGKQREDFSSPRSSK